VRTTTIINGGEPVPSIFEKVALNLCKELSTLWAIVITEISKRPDMGTVSGFVAVFVPIGNFECAIGPLGDTALYILTTGAPVRID